MSNWMIAFQQRFFNRKQKFIAYWQEQTNRDIRVVFGGHALRLLLGMVSSVALARGLGPEAFSVFAVIAAARVIGNAVADFGLHRSAIHHIAHDLEHDEAKAMQTAVRYAHLKFLGTILITGLALLLATPISQLLKLPAETGKWLVYLGSLSLFATGISGLFATLLHAMRRFRPLVIMQTANISITAVLMCILWLTGYLTIASALILGSITAVVAAIIGYFFLAPAWRVALWQPASLWNQDAKKLIAYGKWLWISTILIILVQQLDLFLANAFLTAVVVGIYALARNLSQKLLILNQSLHVVLLPNVSSLSDPSAYRHYVRHTFIRSLLLVLAIIPFIPLVGYLLPIVYGKEYLSAVPIAYGLMVIILFDLLVSPLYLLLFPLKLPQLTVVNDTIQLVILLLLGVWLLPIWGISGIIMAQFTSKLLGAAFIGSILFWRLRQPQYR